MSWFTWFRHPQLQWVFDHGLVGYLHRHTARAFLVTAAVLGALVLVGGPANAAPAVTSLDGGSSHGRAQSTCTTLVTSPVSPVPQGTAVTLTAMVTPATAAGAMQFKDGAMNLGAAVPVANGTAATRVPFDTGAHSLTAVFTPTDSKAFKSSTSPAVSLTVMAAAPQPTTPPAAMPAPAQPAPAQPAPVQPAAQVQPLVQVVQDDNDGLVPNLTEGLGDLVGGVLGMN